MSSRKHTQANTLRRRRINEELHNSHLLAKVFDQSLHDASP